jgi:enamine deaminase RidA (YjgF/YER057c/UK114 family)
MTDNAIISASAEARLSELGITLPAVKPPAGTFVHAVRSGNLLFLSGHVPFRVDGSLIVGKLGQELDVPAGYEAARWAALNAVATMRHELGTLDHVHRIIRLFGVINATPEFIGHTQVMNGASDVLVDIFGGAGKHARLAVGMSSLPFNIALEVELTVEVAA